MGRRPAESVQLGRSSKSTIRKAKHSKSSSDGNLETDGLDHHDRRKVKRHSEPNGNGHSMTAGTQVGSEGTTSQTGVGRGASSRRHRSKPLDPTLLARGMTARSIGARISSQITPLTPSELERDLRHMEAYSAACITYAQQFFAYHNHELVARGLYGSAVTLAPGLASSLERGGSIPPTPSLPIRIDPEEEQRLSILRKRVQASEAIREVLETEYMSLRSHFVFESQRLKRTRSWVTGQVGFWKEVVKRKGRVVALRRIRAAMAMDVWKCLEYRAKHPVSSNGSNVKTANKPAPEVDDNATNKEENTHKEDDKKEDEEEVKSSTPMEGVELTSSATQENGTSNVTTTSDHNTNTDPASSEALIHLWDELESHLREAEQACNEIQTPPELLTLKSALGSDANAMEQKVSQISSVAANSAPSSTGTRGRPSRSPARLGEEDEANASVTSATTTTESKKKKEKAERSSKRDSSDRDELPGQDDDEIIPWPCQTMPMTPHGVALLLSNLSQAPDACSAFAINNELGNKNPPMAWVEPNIPRTVSPDKEVDEDKLERLRKEVQMLQDELDQEISSNKEFQQQIIEGRKRSDEICTMMTLLRTETEAVIERHNNILETPEASHRSSDLYANGGSEGIIQQYEDLDSGNYQEEEEEGTVVADEDEGDAEDDGSFGVVDENKNSQSDSAEDGEIEEERHYTEQPIKEVMVPNISGDGGEEGEINEDGDGEYTALNSHSMNNNKRGYEESGAVTLGDSLEHKRRKLQV